MIVGVEYPFCIPSTDMSTKHQKIKTIMFMLFLCAYIYRLAMCSLFGIELVTVVHVVLPIVHLASILSFTFVQMSLAEYKKRQRKLKPKSIEPERRAPSSAVPAKTHVPSPSKNLVNSPPPASVKRSTSSGFLELSPLFGSLWPFS